AINGGPKRRMKGHEWPSAKGGLLAFSQPRARDRNSMKQEFAIHSVSDDVLAAELAHFVDYFLEQGHTGCAVLFGWHWGMDYYPTSHWDWLDIALDELQSEVQKVQDTDIGRIGGDDLHIRIPAVACEFCFCHHSGIHISFEEPGP